MFLCSCYYICIYKVKLQLCCVKILLTGPEYLSKQDQIDQTQVGGDHKQYFGIPFNDSFSLYWPPLNYPYPLPPRSPQLYLWSQVPGLREATMMTLVFLRKEIRRHRFLFVCRHLKAGQTRLIN